MKWYEDSYERNFNLQFTERTNNQKKIYWRRRKIFSLIIKSQNFYKTIEREEQKKRRINHNIIKTDLNHHIKTTVLLPGHLRQEKLYISVKFFLLTYPSYRVFYRNLLRTVMQKARIVHHPLHLSIHSILTVMTPTSLNKQL